MIGPERQKSIAVAFAVSLAVHVAVAAAISLVPTGPSAARQVPNGVPPFRLGTSFDRSTVVPSRNEEPRERAGRASSVSGASGATGARGRRPGQPAVVRMNPAGTTGSPSGEWRLLQPISMLAEKAESSDASPWVDHLWQSTLFAAAMGLLTLACRRNQARVRFWLWFGASVKFLIPFSLLVALGNRLPLAADVRTVAAPVVSFAVAQVSQPFPDGLPSLPPASTSSAAGWIALAILGIWACGLARVVLMRLDTWLNIRRAVRASTPATLPDVAIPSHVKVRMAPGLMEPGVVGFWRPVLLLPTGIERHLTVAQLNAVVAHEVCHIRRWDNVTAGVHMINEAIFWFHPLVWWIGGRMVDERERACDEEVLHTLGDPRAYADAILNVCRQYVDARLACVAGVSSSNLRRRIESIMKNENGEVLGLWRKVLLGTAAVATVAVPIVIGSVNAPPLRAQAPARAVSDPVFEAASVKANKSGRPGWRLEPQPGGRLTATNVPADALIRFAYDRPDFQVFGGPDWLENERFDVVAKAEGDPPVAQKRLMLRRLLEERFKLIAHTETRELPIYALAMARSDGRMGPNLRRTTADCTRTEPPATDVTGFGPGPATGPAPCGFFGFAPGTSMPDGRGGFAFRGLTMATLAKVMVPIVRRSVTDQTGLSGFFDAEFDFMAELPPPPPPPGIPNPWGPDPFLSVFTVFPEQLGLKLDAQRGPVDVLVIDSAERPVPD